MIFFFAKNPHLNKKNFFFSEGGLESYWIFFTNNQNLKQKCFLGAGGGGGGLRGA